jgi:hypothetical protein
LKSHELVRTLANEQLFECRVLAFAAVPSLINRATWCFQHVVGLPSETYVRFIAMKFESIASVLNIRQQPAGVIIGELLLGDRVEVAAAAADTVWTPVKVTTGLSAGREGVVRRKWLVQVFDTPPTLAADNRKQAAQIIKARTLEFDAVSYSLGEKAKSWTELKTAGSVDCSGWVYLLAKEIFGAYGKATKPGVLYTFSDQQITNVGKATKTIISGAALDQSLFVPGCLVGLDFAEYSWDRNRPLDIDHVVIIGADATGTFVSQSSSGGGGVNRVPLDKWLASTDHLRRASRMHLVDLLLMS